MPAIRRHWTAASVRALIYESPLHWPRYELIDGELVVTPAPEVTHQLAVQELGRLLFEYALAEHTGIAFVSPADLELRPGTITQPDLFVVPAGGAPSAGGRSRWADVRSLLLAIEVISPSSTRIDRIKKRDYYLDVGVPDYLVVDVDARMIEHWRSDRSTPTVLREQFVWHPRGASRPVTVSLPALFDRIDAYVQLISRQVR